MAPGKVMEEVQSPDRSEIQRNLASFAALKTMSPGDLQKLAEKIIVYTFHADDQLMEKRGAGDYLYLVQSGRLQETGKDSTGVIWWQRTHDTGAAFSRQASYGGLYEETEVIGLAPGCLYAIEPSELNWIMTKVPDLRQALVREPIAARLRAMPLLAPLDDSQIRRLATLARVDEVPAGDVVCETAQTDAEAWFWFIDWGQVNVTYTQPIMADSPRTITSGNFLHNSPHVLGQIPPVKTATVLYRAKLIRLPFYEMTLLEKTEAIVNRLQPPPIIKALRSIDLLQELQDEQIQQLASITAWEHYPAPQTVSQQGVRDNALRILHRGAAVVRATDDEGRERPRDFMVPGRSYGQSSLFRQERHETTVRAVRPDSAGGTGTLLTSPIGQDDPAHADEPGATWFRVRYEDLSYLIKSDPVLWQRTNLLQRVEKERKVHRKYPWQEDDEVVRHDSHRHPIVLLKNLLAPALIVVALFVLDYGLWRLRWEVPIGALIMSGLVVVGLVVAWVVVDYLNDYFVVTSLRATAREQVFMLYEKRTEAPLDQVQDTTLNIGFFGGLIGYGDLRIKTANAAIQIKFDRVKDPAKIQGIISEHRRRLLAERFAEQRESLRIQLLKDLHLSLLSQMPDFTLPPGLKPPQRLAWWQRLFALLAQVVRIIFLPVEWLLLRPIRWLTRTLFRRRLASRKRGEEFAGGRLGSWDVTPERTVWRKHWLILFERVWESFLTWLIVVGFGVIALYKVLPIPLLAPLVLFVPATAWLWWQYEDWANDLYIVTNEKVIDIERKPFGFSEQRREASLDRIQNVVTEVPTFWSNFLNYGNVLIKTAAADEGFTFDLVADPRRVQREIMRRLSVYRTSRQQSEASAQRAQQAYFLGVYHELMEEGGKYIKDNPQPGQGRPGHRTAPRSTPGP